MSSLMSTKTSTNSGLIQGSWESAILEAEREILKAKERLAGLRSALRVFKESRDSGEPFPGGKEVLGQPKDL
jgi:hypothetical protein